MRTLILLLSLMFVSSASAQMGYNFGSPNRPNPICSGVAGDYVTSFSLTINGIPKDLPLTIWGKDQAGNVIYVNGNRVEWNDTTAFDTLNNPNLTEWWGDGALVPFLGTPVRVHTICVCGPIPYAIVEAPVQQQ